MEVKRVDTYKPKCEECIKRDSEYVIKTYKNWHYLCEHCISRLSKKMSDVLS
ncbi:hypothetical protein H7U08_25120 [Bacillus cereus]|uniref:Uncharacterized protein n=1 Tax=Bacillus cereus TaxID=1396 RepID=A0AAW4R2A9_BACCE|nr:hypothetical protein [Bacillus cereus]MBY0039785.1 hypothetical protein [Bacillus cereus]